MTRLTTTVQLPHPGDVENMSYVEVADYLYNEPTLQQAVLENFGLRISYENENPHDVIKEMVWLGHDFTEYAYSQDWPGITHDMDVLVMIYQFKLTASHLIGYVQALVGDYPDYNDIFKCQMQLSIRYNPDESIAQCMFETFQYYDRNNAVINGPSYDPRNWNPDDYIDWMESSGLPRYFDFPSKSEIFDKWEMYQKLGKNNAYFCIYQNSYLKALHCVENGEFEIMAVKCGVTPEALLRIPQKSAKNYIKKIVKKHWKDGMRPDALKEFDSLMADLSHAQLVFWYLFLSMMPDSEYLYRHSDYYPSRESLKIINKYCFSFNQDNVDKFLFEWQPECKPGDFAFILDMKRSNGKTVMHFDPEVYQFVDPKVLQYVVTVRDHYPEVPGCWMPGALSPSKIKKLVQICLDFNTDPDDFALPLRPDVQQILDRMLPLV